MQTRVDEFSGGLMQINEHELSRRGDYAVWLRDALVVQPEYAFRYSRWGESTFSIHFMNARTRRDRLRRCATTRETSSGLC